MTTPDPFALDPIDPPKPAIPSAPADTQLARLHTHEAAIQRVESLAGTTIEADGEKTVDAVRKSAKAVRCEIDNCRKALNADALDWQRRVNDLAKRLTARVQPVEDAMQAQLDRAAKEKADRIRQAQAQLHSERFAELQNRHGEWGVNELRATSPLTLVGYSPEAWSALLDTLDTRRKEQEIAARKRAEAEAEAAKQREEAQRIAREEQQKRAEAMRLQAEERERIRQEQEQRLQADREQRRQQWEEAETARLEGAQQANFRQWYGHILSSFLWPAETTPEQRKQLNAATDRLAAEFRRILEIERRPFPG